MKKPNGLQASPLSIIHCALGLLFVHALTGCGSGQSPRPVPAAIPPASPAAPSSPAVGTHGRFVGTVRIAGQDYFGDALLTTDGQIRLYVGAPYSATGALQTARAESSIQFVGNFAVPADDATGTGVAIGQGCATASPTPLCGETGSGEFSLALDMDGLGLYGEIEVTTEVGSETWLVDLWPWNWYPSPARLDELDGQYNDALAEFAGGDGVLIVIDQSGQLFFQSAGSGCTGNGTVTPHMDGAFNVYDATVTIGNCHAPYRHLNGDYQGLATTTPSDYWSYDGLLRMWLSKEDGTPSQAAVTLLANPIFGAVSVTSATASRFATVGSDLPEVNEDFSMNLSAPTGGAQLAASEAATVIGNTDGPSELAFLLAVFAPGTGFFVSETNPVANVQVVRLRGSTGAVSVDFSTINGSATAGTDFVAAQGTLAWADGEAGIKSIAVQILGDGAAEGDEAFQIELRNPSGGATLAPRAGRLQKINIRDDEAALGFPGNPGSRVEIGEASGSVVLHVFRTGDARGAVSLNFSTSSGSATAGADFTSSSGTLNWAAGDSGSKTITVGIASDGNDESDESFTVSLSSPSGVVQLVSNRATASILILDDDSPTPDPPGDGGGGALDWLLVAFLLTWLAVCRVELRISTTRTHQLRPR